MMTTAFEKDIDWTDYEREKRKLLAWQRETGDYSSETYERKINEIISKLE